MFERLIETMKQVRHEDVPVLTRLPDRPFVDVGRHFVVAFDPEVGMTFTKITAADAANAGTEGVSDV